MIIYIGIGLIRYVDMDAEPHVGPKISENQCASGS